jgi:hypothetical protein
MKLRYLRRAKRGDNAVWFIRSGASGMLAEALVALASLAGNTVVAAATTDAWEAARHKIAGLLGRGDLGRTTAAERWLADTHRQLTQSTGPDAEPMRVAQAMRYADRFADLLDEDPGIETELRTWVAEIQATLPTRVALATDHSVAGTITISTQNGGVAAGVIHGDVMPPGPPAPGPALS